MRRGQFWLVWRKESVPRPGHIEIDDESDEDTAFVYWVTDDAKGLVST